MIHPAPTTPIEMGLARGTLVNVIASTRLAQPDVAVVAFANSNYEMHVVVGGPLRAELGGKVIGRIAVEARRVDRVDTGGKYVEPVYGRPRRVQGRVISWDDGARTLVVDAGVPIHLEMLDARQCPSDFAKGALVSCDVRDGAVWTPVG